MAVEATTHRWPAVLLIGYLVLFAICAIGPFDRNVWWVENLPIVLIVLMLVISYRWHQFSAISYAMMACLIYLHTIGGHFTFERVPFELVTEYFGFERNHYDRIAHFTVGFYAYPIAEFLLTRRMVHSRMVLHLFPVFSILSVAAVYEIFEWWFALVAQPGAGLAVLGSQGDQWDAQKDMLADALGAIVAMILFRFLYRDAIRGMPV